MKLILCVDDRFGMMFNNRRQTQDGVLREYLLELAGSSGIWTSVYTAKQFKTDTYPITVSDDLSQTPVGCYCFNQPCCYVRNDKSKHNHTRFQFRREHTQGFDFHRFTPRRLQADRQLLVSRRLQLQAGRRLCMIC